MRERGEVKRTMTKRNFAIILLMMLLVSTISPATVLATDGDMFNDFNVTIGPNNTVNVDGNVNQTNAWKTLLDKYKGFITGIAAVGAVTMVVFFIMNFLKLGANSGNSKARGEAIVGLLWTGIAAAGLGAVALITGIFYNFLK